MGRFVKKLTRAARQKTPRTKLWRQLSISLAASQEIENVRRSRPPSVLMSQRHKVILILLSVGVTFTLWYSLATAQSRQAASHTPIGRQVSQPPRLGDHHLFFIETSCADTSSEPPGHRGLSLTARQACALESAARANPKTPIYLFHTCPLHEDALQHTRVYVRKMLDYPNVRLMWIDLKSYFLNTPLELFYKIGAWTDSEWPKEHSSDVLRFLSLWKFGGTYLDLDVVVRRPFFDLGSNYAGAESDTLLASVVLNFGADALGREVAKQCLTEIANDFRGNDWGYNGPGLVTRVLTRFCGVEETEKMIPKLCSGFTVYPTTVFCPVLYHEPDLQLLFNQSQSEIVMKRLENSHSVHIWNKLSHDKVVVVGSRQPYALLAQDFCPKVYSHCGSIF